MKEILVTFLTDAGKKAYEEIELEGRKQSWHDRKVSNAVAVDEVVSQKPFVVRIKIKIGWLAEQVKLDEQTRMALLKKGLVENKDFKIKVV